MSKVEMIKSITVEGAKLEATQTYEVAGYIAQTLTSRGLARYVNDSKRERGSKLFKAVKHGGE